MDGIQSVVEWAGCLTCLVPLLFIFIAFRLIFAGERFLMRHPLIASVLIFVGVRRMMRRDQEEILRQIQGSDSGYSGPFYQ